MHAAMPTEDRSVFEARAIRLFELLEDKGLGRNRRALAIAIEFRLEALTKLHNDIALRAWTLPSGEPGMDYISADLLAAAAEEPLIEDAQGRAAFDVESFRRRVLSKSDLKGSA